MKEYKKPSMMTLSLSANDALCSGCADKNFQLRDDESLQYAIIEANPLLNLDKNGDWALDFNEGGNLFTEDDKCGTPIEFDGYCKFTGANTLMWS